MHSNNDMDYYTVEKIKHECDAIRPKKDADMLGLIYAIRFASEQNIDDILNKYFEPEHHDPMRVYIMSAIKYRPSPMTKLLVSIGAYAIGFAAAFAATTAIVRLWKSR
jgi:hypothetical protein